MENIDSTVELRQMISNLEQRVDELVLTNKRLIDTNTRLLDILNDNMGAIKLQRQMQHKGKEHPCYRHDLSTEEVVKDYMHNGSKITQQMLSKYNKDKEHKITYNGLRVRLQKAGVWVSRNEKQTV